MRTPRRSRPSATRSTTSRRSPDVRAVPRRREHSMRRVAITGLGTINALGNDVETFWSRVLRGENGVGPITRFDTKDHAVHFAASVDWDPLKHFTTPDLRKLDPFTMWALVASDEALRDAG